MDSRLGFSILGGLVSVLYCIFFNLSNYGLEALTIVQVISSCLMVPVDILYLIAVWKRIQILQLQVLLHLPIIGTVMVFTCSIISKYFCTSIHNWELIGMVNSICNYLWGENCLGDIICAEVSRTLVYLGISLGLLLGLSGLTVFVNKLPPPEVKTDLKTEILVGTFPEN